MLTSSFNTNQSLTAARSSSSSEPSDAIRVVNAILTQLDRIKSRKNVLVLTTSNITGSIDIAFVDRADIKQYIGPPSVNAIYDIFSNLSFPFFFFFFSFFFFFVFLKLTQYILQSLLYPRTNSFSNHRGRFLSSFLSLSPLFRAWVERETYFLLQQQQ